MFLSLLRSTEDARVRKFAALKVYEEFVLATEDLATLYFALRDRDQRPVLESFLNIDIDAKRSAQWQRELESANDIEVLEGLRLIQGGSPLGWPDTQAKQAMEVLRRTVGNMRAAAHHRTVEGGIMVKSFNKLKHGFVAVARGDFVLGEGAPADWVTTMMMNKGLGRLVYGEIEATESKVAEFAATIEASAAATAVLVVSYLRSTGWVPSEPPAPDRRS